MIGAVVRDNNIRYNVILSFLFKGLSIGLSFYLVPLTLKLLGKEFYGVWIVMLSILTWISLFDVGIGNGLRNKLTENISQGNLQAARANISTAYIIIFLIGLFLMACISIAIPFLNWQEVYNLTSISNNKLRLIMFVFFLTLILIFILGLINPILNSFQLSAYTNLTSILTSLVFIVLLYSFRQSIENDLFTITCFYCIASLTSYLTITLFFFIYRKDILIPKIRFFQKSLCMPLLSLGSSFFIIQIAVLLIFTVDNFLILQLLGPEFVSIYNVSFKLFSVFTIGYSIIMTPLWSAFTEAYINKDIKWIKKTIKSLKLSLLPLLFCIIIFIIFNQNIIDAWLSKSQTIKADFNLSLCLAIFVLISVWNNIYSFFLNGVSETSLQKKTAIFGALINIPIAYLFVEILNYGLSGIVIAMCFSLLPFSIFGPIESKKIMNKLTL